MRAGDVKLIARIKKNVYLDGCKGVCVGEGRSMVRLDDCHWSRKSLRRPVRTSGMFSMIATFCFLCLRDLNWDAHS